MASNQLGNLVKSLNTTKTESFDVVRASGMWVEHLQPLLSDPDNDFIVKDGGEMFLVVWDGVEFNAERLGSFQSSFLWSEEMVDDLSPEDIDSIKVELNNFAPGAFKWRGSVTPSENAPFRHSLIKAGDILEAAIAGDL